MNMICQCGRGYQIYKVFYNGHFHRNACQACANRLAVDPRMIIKPIGKPAY